MLNKKSKKLIFIICLILISIFMYKTIFRNTDTSLVELKMLNQMKVEKITFSRLGFKDVVYTDDEVINDIIESLKTDKWKQKSWNLKLAPNREIIIDNYIIGLYDTEKNYLSIRFSDKSGVYKFLIPDNVYEEIIKYFNGN